MKARKSLGQNFLTDETVSRRIIAAVAPQVSDIIFEIGPGAGALTRLLIEQSGLVVAVELDRRLVEHLQSKLQAANFLLLEADALTVDWAALFADALRRWQSLYPQSAALPRLRVVANLPYYISTPILERLLRQHAALEDLTLMLQEEVVNRIASPPGGREYGYLSLLAQYYATAEKLFTVPPSAFSPVPKVTSAIVRLRFREAPAVSVVSEERFFALLRAAFAQRRKTIFNNLKAAVAALRFAVAPETALAAAQIEARRRAETLTLQEFATLDAALFAPSAPALAGREEIVS